MSTSILAGGQVVKGPTESEVSELLVVIAAIRQANDALNKARLIEFEAGVEQRRASSTVEAAAEELFKARQALARIVDWSLLDGYPI